MLIKAIRNFYRRLYKKLYSKRKPVKYAKKIGVNFGENFHIYGEVFWSTEPWIITIGNNVHITDNVRFLTHDASAMLFRDKIPDLEKTRPIVVGDNVFIGNCAIIMSGVTIGSNVVIGAGAVVTKNIPDNSVAVGVPARVVETADDLMRKMEKESLKCGNLKGEEKDLVLRKIYSYKGKSNGIYF